ncbi:MAG: hypothetical protein LBT66_06955 [Methanobrevibacter sp.]|jgi:hypothetical protein|nr:hypothetical protein [Candidatus Methanovirga meridionalis]
MLIDKKNVSLNFSNGYVEAYPYKVDRRAINNYGLVFYFPKVKYDDDGHDYYYEATVETKYVNFNGLDTSTSVSTNVSSASPNQQIEITFDTLKPSGLPIDDGSYNLTII